MSDLTTRERNLVETILSEFQKEVQDLLSDRDVSFELTVRTSDEVKQKQLLTNILRGPWNDRYPHVNQNVRRVVYDRLYYELVGLSVIAELWHDDSITEIFVDGWDNIYAEKDGQLVDYPNLKFKNEDHAARVARNLASVVSGRELTRANPLVTARLPNARVAFAFDPVVNSGLSISLRKFRKLLGMEQLVELDSLTVNMYELLKDAVAAQANIIVSGSTGSGKTTLINGLSSFIPDEERVITIEDSFELMLTNRHKVALQAKEAASADDQVRVTIADLLVQTLRMKPSRIVVGEVRDGDTATVLLEAANTGHDGTMTTLHCNSAHDAVNSRLPGLLKRKYPDLTDEVSKQEISRAFELVVHATQQLGKRYVSEIAEVIRYDPDKREVVLNPLVQAVFDPETLSVTHEIVGRVSVDETLAHKMRQFGVNRDRWLDADVPALEDDAEIMVDSVNDTAVSRFPSAGQVDVNVPAGPTDLFAAARRGGVV